MPWLRRFYFGAPGEEGLKELVSDLGDIDARDVSSFPLAGTDIVVRVGRYGPYLERDGQRVNVPDGTAPDELTPEFAAELLSRPSGDKILGTDPATGRTIVRRRAGSARTSPSSSAEGAPASAKPRTASLLKSMDLDSVTLDDALRLLTLPRTLGETRRRASDRAERALWAVCQEGHGQPVAGDRGADVHDHPGPGEGAVRPAEAARPGGARRQRRRCASSATTPASGKPIVLRDGRFGPYVTDGETNASLRKGDTAESITPQRAVELLAERRAAAPSPKRQAGRSRAKSGGSATRSGSAASRRDPSRLELAPRRGDGPGSRKFCRYPNAVNFRSPLGSGRNGVLSIRPFRRLWIALSLSSLGDWLSLLALTALACDTDRRRGDRAERRGQRRLAHLAAARADARPAGRGGRRPVRPADQHDRRRRGARGAVPVHPAQPGAAAWSTS